MFMLLAMYVHVTCKKNSSLPAVSLQHSNSLVGGDTAQVDHSIHGSSLAGSQFVFSQDNVRTLQPFERA